MSDILNQETIFFFQMIGVVSVGGLIGEYYRTALLGFTISTKVFLANFLAGSFVSFIIAYLFFYWTQNKIISLLLGGILSYQDEKFLKNISEKIIKKIFFDNDKGGSPSE